MQAMVPIKVVLVTSQEGRRENDKVELGTGFSLGTCHGRVVICQCHDIFFSESRHLVQAKRE